MLPLIQDLPKPEEREFYTQKLARFLRIDERAFIGTQPRSRITGARRKNATARGATPRIDRTDAAADHRTQESGGHMSWPGSSGGPN